MATMDAWVVRTATASLNEHLYTPTQWLLDSSTRHFIKDETGQMKGWTICYEELYICLYIYIYTYVLYFQSFPTFRAISSFLAVFLFPSKLKKPKVPMMYPSLATGKVIATRAIAVTLPEINIAIMWFMMVYVYVNVCKVCILCMFIFFLPLKIAGGEMIRLPFGLNGLFSEAKCPVSFREGRCYFCWSGQPKLSCGFLVVGLGWNT